MLAFGSVIRCFLLALFLLSSMATLMFAHVVSEGIFTALSLICTSTLLIYLLISVISIVAHQARRFSLDEQERLKSDLMDISAVYPNIQVINYFRRIALWDALLVALVVYALGVPMTTILSESSRGSAMADIYCGFLLWGPLFLVILFVLSLVFWACYIPHGGDKGYTFAKFVTSLIVSDFMEPYLVVKDLFFGKGDVAEQGLDVFDARSRPALLLRFATMLLFIIVNVARILALR